MNMEFWVREHQWDYRRRYYLKCGEHPILRLNLENPPLIEVRGKRLPLQVFNKSLGERAIAGEQLFANPFECGSWHTAATRLRIVVDRRWLDFFCLHTAIPG